MPVIVLDPMQGHADVSDVGERDPRKERGGENDNAAHSLLAPGLKWRLLGPAAYRASRRAATIARLLTADVAHVASATPTRYFRGDMIRK